MFLNFKFFSATGIVTVAPFLEVTEDDWNKVIDVNLKGVFLVWFAVQALAETSCVLSKFSDRVSCCC